MFSKRLLVVMISSTIMTGCSAIADNKTFKSLPVDLEGNEFARVDSGGSIDGTYAYSISKINDEKRPPIARTYALPANRKLMFSVECYDKKSERTLNSNTFYQTLEANQCYKVIGASTERISKYNFYTTNTITNETTVEKKSYSSHFGSDFCNAVKLKEVECTPNWSSK